jgi:alkylhydroperoxidase family enzyme
VARIAVRDGTEPEFFRAMAAAGDLGAAVRSLNSRVYQGNELPIRVREVTRMRIALINNCFACRGARFDGMTEDLYEHVREWRTYPGYSPAERLAIDYAERFAEDHFSIDDDFMALLREHFTEREVLALTIDIAYFLAFGRVTQVLELYDACALDGSPIGRENDHRAGNLVMRKTLPNRVHLYLASSGRRPHRGE